MGLRHMAERDVAADMIEQHLQCGLVDTFLKRMDGVVRPERMMIVRECLPLFQTRQRR